MNVERYTCNPHLLLDKGYKVLLVWEFALQGQNKQQPDQLLISVGSWLTELSSVAVADIEGFTDVRETKRCIHRCRGKIPNSS